ncbi:ATP-binding protein [Halovivax sp.]|uniref:sensor histidine kinase n=1 Tax=Halovivax sp. TaxID=1935978 RepID=UPI0025BEAE84|nr:ATP-binding protein [Halovivax sp.]
MRSWPRYLYALGVLFLATAVGQSLVKVGGGGPPLEALIDFVLVGLPGALILYVGRRLSRSNVDESLYPRIAGWCLAGVGVMFVFLLFRAAHPGVGESFSFATRAIALAIGSVAGLAIGVHDARALTREREVERRNEALNRTRDQLERRNQELDGTRERLEEAVEELEASNERLDQFATTASHDLREPLRMISRYLELLSDRHAGDLDDEATEFLEFATDGADRMRTMVDDLLRYARVESEGEPLEPVDLDAVFADAVTDLQVRIEETDADVEAGPLPRVRGDPGQLRQLFQNLLSNAIAYSGDEPPRIRVSADRVDDAWVVSVRDEGIGIDPAEQDRIFELFQRLHGVDEHDGSGIGLALCRRIVERHGGEISVDSTPGEGSTFSFTLPAAAEASRPAGPASHE